MIKISANNEVELSGEANGVYFVVYKDSISPLTPSTEIALIEACDKIAALEARLKEAVVMLDEAHKHLEFCGYGDAYERDCARDDKLDQRITAILEANSELLEAQA